MTTTDPAMKLYCLSGLGVDHRAFQNMQPRGIELLHIRWIDPLPGESLKEHAARLYETVKPEDGYNLLGLSFGGILAAEFARIKKPRKLFLISTISGAADLQFIFKVGIHIGMTKWIPSALLKKPNTLLFYLFGASTAAEKDLFRKLMRETDARYLKWAVGAIASWKGYTYDAGIKIHGDHDRLLPFRGHAKYLLRGGSHFMILNRGPEIAEIIERELKG